MGSIKSLPETTWPDKHATQGLEEPITWFRGDTIVPKFSAMTPIARPI
jgi:hypothetical protein